MTRCTLLRFVLVAALATVPSGAAPSAHPVGGAPPHAVEAVARETAAFPPTAAGANAREWLAAFNTGTEAALRAFFAAHVSAGAAAQLPIDERVRRNLALRGEAGPLEPVRVKESADDHVTFLARSRNQGAFEVRIETDPAPPHGFLGARLESIDSDALAETPTPVTPLSRAALAGEIDRLAAEGTNGDPFSGVILVTRLGETLFEKAYGLAERRFSAPNRLETRFNLGSINKIFTKTAIAQLVEQHRLSLDDTIDRWLPDYPRDVARRITIAQLVDMTSGLGDFFGADYDALDKSRLRRLADYVPLFEHQPLHFEPGAGKEYSNAGYVLLGEIIEKVSGQEYAEYMKAHVWSAAGMHDTDLYESDVPVPNVAMGYTRRAPVDSAGTPTLRENVFTRPARGSSAGGGYSTVHDLLAFTRALRSHTLAGAAWSDWVAGGPRPGSAAAAGASRAGGGFGFAGGAPGINAVFTVEESDDVTVVVLANQDPPAAEHLPRLVRALVRRLSS